MTPATLSVIGHQGGFVCNTVVALRPKSKQHMGCQDTGAAGKRRVVVDDDFDWRELETGGQPVVSRYAAIVVN